MRGCRFNQQTDHKTLKGSNTREIRPIKSVRTATLRQRRGVHRNVHARYGENVGLYCIIILKYLEATQTRWVNSK